MDKVEYQQKLEELTALVAEKDFKGALAVVDAVDWRRVKSVKTLNMVADVYEYNRNYEKLKEILVIAHSRTAIGRSVLARLVEVCLQLGQVDQAEKYFREFSKVAQNDNSRYVLQYKLYKAKQAPLEAQIAVLEEYREREYTERWAYELAELYARAGEQNKCIEACDDLILWFSEGKYVLKAMELKKNYEPLSEKQQVLYSRERDAENERARQAAAARAAEEAKAREAKARAEAEKKAMEAAEAAANEKAEAEASAEEETGGSVFPEPSEPVSDAVPVPEGQETAFSPDSQSEQALAEDGLPGVEGQEALVSEMEELADEEKTAREALAAKETGPIDLKHRLLRSFHNMFSSSPEDDEFPEEAGEAKPAVKEKAVSPFRRREWPFKKKEVPEEELKVRELTPESDIIYKDTVTEASEEAEPELVAVTAPVPEEISGAAPETPADTVPVPEEKPEVQFDLDKFLSETAGSFSDEIGSGEYRATTEEAPLRLDEDINTLEEEAAKDAARTGMTELSSGSLLTDESIQAVINGVEPITELTPAEEPAAEILEEESLEEAPIEEAPAEEFPEEAPAEEAPAEEAPAAAPAEEPAEPAKKKPHYIEELEVPDPEPTPEERKAHTIPLGTIGQNTVPISIDKILSEESPEEQRIRILNRAKPTRMSEEQRRVFTYFARIPGMDSQILEALSGVYEHAGERTSLHGNLGVMGAKGTGKTRLSRGLVVTMCKDLDLKVAKIARIKAEDLNRKDPVRVASIMSGGFLMIEDVSKLTDDTVERLNQAMEFRTDCMIVIIEDEKSAMRAFLKSHPVFAAKFDGLISIPVFTNDELVTFARTYAAENGYQLDDLGILALYTKIGNQQTEEKPVTISDVKVLVDSAIDHASKGRRRSKRGRDSVKMQILHEKDFE